MDNFNLDTNPKLQSGFAVPKEYFDTFTDRLMQNLPAQEPKVVSFYARNKSWFYSAAAILIIASTLPILNQFTRSTSEVSKTEMENYLAYHSTLTDEDIVNLLDSEDIEKLAVETPIDNLTADDIMSQNVDVESYITN